MRLGRIAVLVAAGWLAMLHLAPARADSIDLSQIVANPNPRLGLSFPGSDTQYYPLIARAGIGVARISVQWALVEPSPGQFNWSGLDSRVAALHSLGIEPFLTFESNADWGTLPETRGVKNARPRDPALWERFVGAVVERYNGDGRNDMPGLRRPVRYWQAANEWISDSNRSGGWVGTAEQLIEYIRLTHDTVKAKNPQAIFVLGGIAAFNLDVLLVARGGYDFTVRQKWSSNSETVFTVAEMRGREIAEIIDGHVMPVLERSPYDIASVHLYGPEERDAARISLISSITRKPVISSECGGPSLDYGASYTPEGHFLAVVERNLGVFAAGGNFCLWFRLGEGPGSTYGNARTALYTSTAQPKPGVFAYRMLSRLLAPQTTVAVVGTDLFELRGSEGGTIRIGWNSGAAQARAFASETGGDAYCLANAEAGRLSSDAGSCRPDALVLAGRNLISLLGP